MILYNNIVKISKNRWIGYMLKVAFLLASSISKGTFLALEEILKKSILLFSGDTEIFITNISYLGLAKDQFMEIHNIMSLCYGGYNMLYEKKSTFTQYKFAFLLLHSTKLSF